jgi:hypothetical protein
MTDLAENRSPTLVLDSQFSPASFTEDEVLDPAGPRRVGWAAGAVFFVWIGLFAAWIFLAPPASTASPATAAAAVSILEMLEPTALPVPTQTPVPLTPTEVPAALSAAPTATPLPDPPPTFTATVPPPTPVHRSPTALTLLEDEVRALTGTGNVVFLGIDNRVVALDVTDPTFPIWIAEAGDLPGPVQRLAIIAEHIYALHPGGVSVLDISEPGDLLEVGYVNTDPGLFDLVPGQENLYGPVGGGQGSLLQVFNVGKPGSPRPSGSAQLLHEPYDFKLLNERGFITHGPRFSILDLEDPADIQVIGTIELPGAAMSVAADHDYAFVGVAGSGIYVVNLADPAALDILSMYPLGGDPVAIQILYDGVLMAVTETRVLLLDVSQPEALQLLGEYELPGRLRDLKLTDDIAFVALGEAGMLVLDLSQ